MDVRSFRIRAPNDDALSGRIIFVGHTRHLAVHSIGHGRRGSRAKRPRQTRRAQPREEITVEETVADHAIGSAVVITDNCFGAVPGDDLAETRDNLRDRLLPRDALKLAFALGART